ncbi:MAG TPA: aminotransferase class V-fold PLP-dependent enzyme [Verrucomicrobiae bacterium]
MNLSAHSETLLNAPACNPQNWWLDPRVTFLNHGAFGACPKSVLAAQNTWRERIERQPLQFLVRELEAELDIARAALAKFVGADTDDLVFVNNTTTGVNTILRSLSFEPGDELIVTDQEYNASRNALNFVAERFGARVVVAKIPFPFQSEDELVQPILDCVTSRTKLALLDHVTSQTGVIQPIARLVQALNQRGVDTLVDGAHAPGMVSLDLNALGAAYFTGNCHKWMCAPKGAALLHVRRDRQKLIRPLAISHGANSARTDRSRFLIEFAWTGTTDPTAWLSVPEALRFMASALPGGWPQVMARNRALALAARKLLCDALKISVPCPEAFIGSIAAVPLPPAPANALPRLPFNEYPLQDTLRVKHGIETPIISWPAPPQRVVRVAAQLYNSLPQFETLAKALIEELDREALNPV